MNSLKFRISPLLACASLAAGLTATAVRADSLHVTTASATTNKAYDLNFAPPGTKDLLITPLSSASVRSIVYVANQATAKTDLIAADQTGSRIVRYAGATGTATTIWTKTTAGPLSPLGLSVDSSGNLYATRGDKGKPELWVLRRNPAQPSGAGFLAPLKIDSTSFGTSTQTRLLDTLVVPVATPGGLGAGDLLVLLDDGRVYRYAAAGLKNFMAGTGTAPAGVMVVPPSNTPPGHSPTGMAFWPTDGSLLVTTVDGSVLRYSLTPSGSAAMPTFATGLGSSATGNGSLLGLIKTFIQSKAPYAVISQPQRNKILELGAPPPAGCPDPTVVCNAPLATISTISSPLALAVTDSSAPTQDCLFDSTHPDNGCTLLGGGIKLGVSSANTGATILDAVCTIDNDPRVVNGACNNSALHVKDLCPGFLGATDNDITIPGYLCGAAGASGRGFSLIKSLEQNGSTTAPTDLLVKQELSADALLGGPGNPPCPQLTAGWAPLNINEGAIPEGTEMIELASYCGSTRILSPGHSLIGVGLQLNPDFFAHTASLPTPDQVANQLVIFANQKLGNLATAINKKNSSGNYLIVDPARTTLASCVTKIGTYLNNGNNNLPNPADRYACAAHQAWTCDQPPFGTGSFNPNTDKLSAYSEIRGRLANLVTHINTRLAGKAAPTSWPLPDPANTNPLPATTCDPDTTPPTAPANFAASTTTQTEITLNWQPSTDSGSGMGGYYLTRTGAATSPLATILASDCTATTCTYTDRNLSVETTYNYQLVAYDKSTLGPNGGPNLTDPVSTSAATQPDTAAPSVPGGLTATLGADKQTSVLLNWSASTDPSPGTGVGGYYVYRNNVLIQTITGNGSTPPATSYTDSSLSPDTASYSYQVKAFDKSTQNPAHLGQPNVSDFSAAAGVTMPDITAPTAPGAISYSYSNGGATLTLSWGASTDPAPYATGIGGYNIYLLYQSGTPLTQKFVSNVSPFTPYTIQLQTTTQVAQFTVAIEAFDQSTQGPGGGPNVSPRTTATVTCYDPDTDHDCDWSGHHD